MTINNMIALLYCMNGSDLRKFQTGGVSPGHVAKIYFFLHVSNSRCIVHNKLSGKQPLEKFYSCTKSLLLIETSGF